MLTQLCITQRMLLLALVTVVIGAGCGETEQSPLAKQETVELSSEQKSAGAQKNARIEMINSLETRAAKSDADAQLALAKMLLDGHEAQPNYERAKDLLVSAAEKALPEATLGLYMLRMREVVKDDRLPKAEILKEKALATGDAFVTSYLFSPSTYSPTEPTEAIFKFADAGYPLANAKLAKYYSAIALLTASCRDEAANMKKLKLTQSKSKLDRCLLASKVPESYQRAIDYASKILDAKEVDADKVRFWNLLARRIQASKPISSSFSPLLKMQIDYVLSKSDQYRDLFADALNSVGQMIKGDTGRLPAPSQAALFFKRAAELGDSAAQNALGEICQTGRGVPKDYEIAARYFAQSAQQGDGDGAKNLGLAFARGQGVEKNPVRAYFWLSISALGMLSQDQANMDSRFLELVGDPGFLRDKLGQGMSAAEIGEAQRLVREWRPSYQVGPPAVVASSNAGTHSDAGNAVQASGVKRKVATGTVFVINPQGYAVTNHHVIESCTELRIDGREELVKRVTSDVVNDLALIQLSGTFPDSATLTPEPGKLRQGEDIVVFGFPLNALLSSGGNLTPGVVSALTGLGNNTNQIQITAPIQPGSSGSPVLNKKGEVVGVVSMKLSDSKMASATGQIGQNVNFAVSGQTLKTFLDTHKVSYSTGGFLSRDKSTADLADEARKWTLVVECWN